MIWACSADLGDFFWVVIGSDGTCTCATRLERRTGRFTAIGVWCAAYGSAVGSFSRRWRSLASLTSRAGWRRGRWRGHLIGAPEQARLFEDGRPDVAVPVRLKGVRVERSRQFGDVYLALALWRGTGLAQSCGEVLPAGPAVKAEKIAYCPCCLGSTNQRLSNGSGSLHPSFCHSVIMAVAMDSGVSP